MEATPTQTAHTAAAAPPPSFTSERFERVDLALIRESATNPRKHFDERALAELVESIRNSGVAIPVLVRDLSTSEQFELIDGARRFRAARDAGCVDIPARIIECDDQTALELQTIANLQREDVHPLDEALGFRQLIERSGYDVAAIAARIGKSETYVYQRLKLTDLCEEGRNLLRTDNISVAVALLIARIPADLQMRIIDAEWPIESARKARDWLDRNVYLRLDKVPWTMGDAGLVPEAGSCHECPKRTGFAPALFPEVEDGDTCTDPACFQRKQQAIVQIKRAEKPADVVEVSSDYKYGSKGEILDASKYHKISAKEAKETEGAKQALVVEGADAGKTIWIRPVSTGGYQKTDAEKQAERERKQEEKIRAEVANRCLSEMLGQVSVPMPDQVLRLLAKKMLDRLTKDGQKRLAKSWDVEPRKVTSQYGGTYVDVETPIHERIDEMSGAVLYAAMVDMACRSGFSGEPDHAVFGEFYPVDAVVIEAKVRQAPEGEADVPAKVTGMPAQPVKAAAKKTAVKRTAGGKTPGKKSPSKKTPVKKAGKSKPKKATSKKKANGG